MGRIDCSNILNFMSEYERRRRQDKDNAICTIEEFARRGGLENEEELKKCVERLQRWSDENPIITRRDKFMKLMEENGFDLVLKYNERYSECSNCAACIDCVDCREAIKYWNEPFDVAGTEET